MFDVKIMGKEKFKLSSAHYIEDAKGEKRICVIYTSAKGYKGALEIKFEGFAKSKNVMINEEYSFASLMKMFEDRRIYFAGVVFLDHQFEKGIAKSE
jgi:hypothetical protein